MTTHPNTPEQAVEPKDILGWQGGPLPQDLEQIALLIFLREYPEKLWYDDLMKGQRNDCRRFALQLRVKFLACDQWQFDTAHDKLADQLAHLIWGDRRLGKTVRQEVVDYCETFMADAWGHFKTRLFYPQAVDANAAEIANEDAKRRN